MNATVQAPLSHRDEALLAALFRRALRQAGDAMVEMSGRSVTISAPDFRRCTADEAIALAGGADVPIIAIYVQLGGGIGGHALLALPISGALRLAARLLDGLAAPPDHARDGVIPELDDLERSALLELGNVIIAAALNALGDRLGEPVHPSVPVLVAEYAGAILDAVLIDLLAESRDVLASRTVFLEAGDMIDGTLLVLPRPESVRRLVGVAQAR